MPFTPRKNLPHEVPPWVKPGSLFFFTLCVRDREANVLTRENIAPALLSAARFYHEQLKWYARLFLIMPDHLHALIAFPSDGEIRAAWQSWKRYTSKETGVVWQRDILEYRLRSNESLDEKAHYIRENPVRKGLDSDAKLWPWVFER
jgi:putative transposase